MELLYLRLGEDFGKEERKVRQLTRAGEGGEECAAADKSRKLGVYCLLTLEEENCKTKLRTCYIRISFKLGFCKC